MRINLTRGEKEGGNAGSVVPEAGHAVPLPTAWAQKPAILRPELIPVVF